MFDPLLCCVNAFSLGTKEVAGLHVKDAMNEHNVAKVAINFLLFSVCNSAVHV